MTINTAEIEARNETNGEWFQKYAHDDIRDLLAALKAETARADKAEVRFDAKLDALAAADQAVFVEWQRRLRGAQEMLVDTQSQLTVANERLAAYTKAEKDAADLYDWFVSVCENPPEPTPALRAVWEKYKDLPAFNTGDGNV